MTSALLIIDVQNALCFGEHAAFDSARIIENANLLAARFRRAGRPVVFVQHESEDAPLQRGTHGWALAQGLHVEPADHIVAKTVADSFHRTQLQPLLQKWGVTSLTVCGLQSEFCIDTTVRRAMALGYPVTLVSDGHSTQDNAVLTAAQIAAHHNETLAHISSFGVRTTPRLAAQIEV